MRLEKAQKEAVIKWVVAGYETDEINRLAADFDPPFEISRRQATYYRKSRGIDMDAIRAAGEQDALASGLALKAERVRKLKFLAELLERDIFGRRLWLDQVKGVGSGEIAEIVEYEEFNTAEVREYRATLDDIAKEMGHRAQQHDIRGDTVLRVEYIDDWRNQAPEAA